MNDQRRPRAGTTSAAAFLIFAVTAFFVVAGIQLLRNALDPSTVDRTTYLTAVGFGLNPDQSRNFTAIIAIVLLVLCLLIAVMGVGVTLRRQGMRHAAIGAFVLFTMVTLPLALGGVSSSQPSGVDAELPGRDPWIGLLVAAVDGLIVVLLLLPKTASDFERIEFARQRARLAAEREREARRQERLAGRA